MGTHQARILGAALVALTGFVRPLPTAAQTADPRPTLAIVGVEASPGGWTLPPPHLGEIVAALMLDRLVASDRYHVLDGQWLPHGRRWQNAPEELRADAAAAGVDYLVLGSITRFSIEQKQRSFGGAAFIVPLVGGFHRQQSQLVVGLSLRVVDVRTGEVVAGATGRGESVRARVSFGGLGALRGGGAGGVTNGSIEFRDAQLDEAVHLSVAAAADNLAHSASRLTRTISMDHDDQHRDR